MVWTHPEFSQQIHIILFLLNKLPDGLYPELLVLGANLGRHAPHIQGHHSYPNSNTVVVKVGEDDSNRDASNTNDKDKKTGYILLFPARSISYKRLRFFLHFIFQLKMILNSLVEVNQAIL